MKKNAHPLHWSAATPRVAQAAMSTAQPNYVIPRRWFAGLADFDLWLVCEGRAELENTAGEKTQLMRGSVLLLRPGDLFEFRVSADGGFANAYIHFNFFDERGNLIPDGRIGIPASTGYVHDIPWFEASMRRIMFLQYQQQQAEPQIQPAIQTLASCLMRGLLHDYELSQTFAESTGGSGIGQHHSQMVSAALSWIYLHPDSTLSAAQLAKKFGYSQRHFGRVFQQVCGKTPGQVLIEARIDHAKKLLSSSSLNISEIASSLNYEDLFYFSRQFSRIVGLSPSDFRRSVIGKSRHRMGPDGGAPVRVRNRR